MGLSSKIKVFWLLGTVLAMAMIGACTSDTTKAEATTQTDQCKAPGNELNPNGSSELSQLMRQMQASADSARQMILAGGVPKNFPEAFKKIHTAKPTDNETKKESFDAFATHYLNKLELLHKSSGANARANYNAMVEACLSCHYDHCPGPIKAINKLKI